MSVDQETEKTWKRLRNKLKSSLAAGNMTLQKMQYLYNEAMNTFEEIGYPDYWQDWERELTSLQIRQVHCKGIFE